MNIPTFPPPRVARHLGAVCLALALVPAAAWAADTRGDAPAAEAKPLKADLPRIDPNKVERPSAAATGGHAAPANGRGAAANGRGAPAGAHAAKAAGPTAAAAHPAAPLPDKAAHVSPSMARPAGMDELRQRLQDKVADVRAAQLRAHAVTLATVAPHGAARARPHAGTPAHGAGKARGHTGHWSYDGAGGPESWGALRPEFSLCGNGTRQSPIDIRGGVRVDLEPIKFDYKAAPFNVVDNGHTVQVNVTPGNTITVNGRSFELVQFHFHRPSEERINGRQFPMVAHLVHKDLDGKLAVVAVLMDQGKSHPMVQLVWNSLPLQRNDPLASPVPMELNLLLPEDRRYYTYMGSLTTPPCSEGVLWLVLKQPASLSAEQLAVFARLYPMNARPIQQASDRLIKESF